VKLISRLAAGLGLARGPAREHVCRFVPIRRGYPQRICICGAMRVGANTITLSPAGVGDVARWSASQAAVAAGDLAMNVSTGRARQFALGFSREMGSVVDGMGSRRQWGITQRVGETTLTEYGILAADYAENGGATLVSTAGGQFNEYSTGAAINGDAGVTGSPFVHTQRQFNPIFSAAFRTGALVTTVRFWIGLFSADPMASATPAVHLMGFRFDTGVDGTTWRAVTDNASGVPTVTDTTVTVSASTNYLLQVVANPAATSVLFFIDGVLRATHAATLPTATQDLGLNVQVRNIVAGARAINFSNLWCSQIPSGDV